MNYDLLRKYQIGERKSNDLFRVPDFFYNSIERYLNEDLEKEAEENNLDYFRLNRIANYIVDEIKNRRFNKIVKKAMTDFKKEESELPINMVGKEAELYNNCIDLFEKYDNM